MGTLFKASDGKLYGTTYGSGANGKGTIFNFDVTTNTLTNLRNLEFPDAYNHVYSGFVETSLTITTGSIADSICAGTNISVPYTIVGTYGQSNIFTAQLSDANGSFSSPVDIGSLLAVGSSTITATIPANTIITATIGTTTDLDYYKITTTVTSDFVVTLTNLAGDYDLVVQSSTGTQIGISENGGTTNESITLAARAAGTYYFFVYGYAGANSSTVCYNLNVAVTATVGCLAPTSLTASNITSTTATVSWGAVASALTYNVEYKLNSSGTWIVASSSNATTTYNFTGLTAGLLYDYRIRSNCASGNSSYAQAQFTTSPICISAYEPNESLAAAVLVTTNTVSYTHLTLPTSDLGVDLGGRRIIKKKKEIGMQK